ncbi:TonB-dependent receptor [Hymenobacter sp. HD11105]
MSRLSHFQARLVVLALALLCAFNSPAAAQNRLVLRGTVADRNTGEKLLGATVRLSSLPTTATATNLDGRFELPTTLAKGDTLIVTYIGYAPYRQSLAAGEQNQAEILVRLRPQASQQLGQVEVTAKRPIAEDFIVRELDYLKIVTNPAAAADPLLAVRTLPAASNTDESASISLRGSDPAQTGIFLNNVPIYDAVKFAQLSGIGTFSIFNVDLVKSVLVFPSNPPLEYGNAGAGLISLTTDDKPRPRFLQGSLGLANSGVMAGMPVGEKGMLKVYGNYQTGELIKAVNPESFRKLSKFGNRDLGGHFSTSLGSYGTLKLFAYGISEQYAYRFHNASLNDTYRYRKNRGFGIASYEKAWTGADLSLSLGASRSRATDGVGNYRAARRNADYYGGLNFRRYWSDALSTRVGLSYDERAIRVGGQFPALPYAMSETAPAYAATIRQQRTLWEAYQYTKWKHQRWVVGVGLRTNVPHSQQSAYLSGQLNLRYDISPRQFLNLSGGQYTSFSSPDAAYYPFLRYRTRQVALDYAYTSEELNLSAAVYAKDENSVLDSRVLGVEVYAQRTFFKKLSADLSLASIRSRLQINSPEAAALAVNQRRYNLPFIVKSNLKYGFKGGQIGSFTQYRSGAPYTPILGAQLDPESGFFVPQYAPELGTSRLPNYFRTDLTASKFIRSRENQNTLVLYVVLSNVLNTRNVSSYSYSTDYSQANPEYFQRRFLYFGAVLTLQ